MFISDKLIFFELHKTGCSQIRNLLKKTIPGKFNSRHNSLSSTPQKNIRIIGSIRNPWEWYVSLWAYGCSKNAGIRYHFAPKRNNLTHLIQLILEKNITLIRLKNFATLKERYSEVKYWNSLYSDVNNTDNFREWLKKILTDKKIELPEEYNDSTLSKFTGFMTYRYFRIFYPIDMRGTVNSIPNIRELKSFDKKECFIYFFIRNENLESDLIKVLELTGYDINEKAKSEIYAHPRTNVSRHRPYEQYYDEDTVKLVSEKEKFIIDKFRYKQPSLN